tara:strand:+ start:16515 stop:16838 length:324 start_codon:yes stop_codon:yes gene_type:complete
MIRSKQQVWLNSNPDWLVKPKQNLTGGQRMFFMKKSKMIERVLITIEDEFICCLGIPNLTDSYSSIFGYFLKKWNNELNRILLYNEYRTTFEINRSYFENKYQPIEK